MFKLRSPLPMYKEIMERNVDVLKLPASKREWQMTEASHFEDMPGLDHKLNTSHGKIHCDPAVMLRVNDGSSGSYSFLHYMCNIWRRWGRNASPQ